ncbi:MAG TPA: phosphoserine phosphatase [Lachnospiraceae bacterium]|nr:phosphoserine phosphatase [Lachnospiraceae bacterium]
MKNDRNSLSRSLLIGCAVFITLLSLIMGSIGFLTYYNGIVGRYETYLHDILKLAMTEIDGDDLERCIREKSKSEQYERTQDFLNRIKEYYDIKYIYIVKPMNLDETDNMMDVMAGITRAEAEEDYDYYSVELGRLTGDYYSPEIVRHYMDACAIPGEVSFYRNKSEEFGYMYTGMIPVLDSAGEPVAVLAADLSMQEITRVWQRYWMIVGAEILILVTFFLFSMYQWLRKRVIAPLKQLEEVSASFVESSRQTQDPSRIDYKRADIHTGDEMEVLSDALNAMFDDTRRYMTNLLCVTAEKEKIGAELNVATQIQADMLPRIFPAFPDRREFDLYALMHPAREVGGDFYDFFLIDEDHLCMVIADVSGKGVPAALFMVIAKTLIKNQAMMGDDPADILGKVNEQLCEGNDAMLFVTVWISILTISTGKGIAANAGHEHPVIRRAGGSYELVVYRHSPAVAAMEGMRFRQHSFELHPGDRLFVYTDGVPEATNAENELFGNERMLDVLNSQPARKPHALLETMKREIDIFVGEAPQFDDITMLCLDYFGPGREQKAEDPEGLTACSDGLT